MYSPRLVSMLPLTVKVLYALVQSSGETGGNRGRETGDRARFLTTQRRLLLRSSAPAESNPAERAKREEGSGMGIQRTACVVSSGVEEKPAIRPPLFMA